MEKILEFLTNFENSLYLAVLLMKNIIDYLCFAAAIILILTSVIADQRGLNIGFNAGKWAISVAVAGTLISVAKNVFGII